MKCDRILGEGYTCNNEHEDPSGLCFTHRDMPGAGTGAAGAAPSTSAAVAREAWADERMNTKMLRVARAVTPSS